MSLGGDLKFRQRLLELQPPAAHIGQRLAEDADLGVFRNKNAGLIVLLTLDEHLAGQDQRAASLTAFNKAALYQKNGRDGI